MRSTKMRWLIFIGIFLFLAPDLGFAQSSAINNAVSKYREFYKAGKHAQAVSAAENAFEMSKSEFGLNHSYTATIMNDLAIFHKALENYSKSRNFFRQALTIQASNFGSGHPIVANTLIGLGQTDLFLKDYAASEKNYQRALKINRRTRQGRSELVVNLGKLAQLYAQTKRDGKAEGLYKEAIGIAENNLGRDHLLTGNFLNILAVFYHQRKNYQAAEPLYQRSLSILERKLGKDHKLVVETTKNLSQLKRQRK
jgi:tetratricopeptide (TPR) repeat protein